MAKRKDDKGRQPPRKKDKELEAIYAKARREFSAADLQKYTVVEKGVPLKKVIKEMEKIQKTYKPKKT
jgi:hypothetical protein